MDPLNAFIGHAKAPTQDELAKELGKSKPLWDRLVAELTGEPGIATWEWSSYSRKAGWSLRGKAGERNIVYLSPCHGCFRASFALGDKAMKAAREAKLPAAVLRVLKTAKRYAEGSAVRLEVAKISDIAAVKTLAAIKLRN